MPQVRPINQSDLRTMTSKLDAWYVAAKDGGSEELTEKLAVAADSVEDVQRYTSANTRRSKAGNATS